MTKRALGWPGILTVLGIAVLWVQGVRAATPPAPPKPGPEHEKLAFFVGKWKLEGVMSANPMFPGGKTSGKNDCQWFDGNFAVICRSEHVSPVGKLQGLGILSYSIEEKTYLYYGLDGSGMAMTSVPRGTLVDSTWTYTDQALMGGNKVKTRYVVQELSPTSASYKWEIEGPDGKWVTVAEGTQAKSK